MLLPALFMLGAAIIGSYGPPVLLSRRPGADSVGIDFTDSVMTTCSTDADGSARTSVIPRCYSHFFTFTSRWTQYFDVQLAVGPPDSAAGQQFNGRLPLHVEWYGQEVSGRWVRVIDGVVQRPLDCTGGGNCWPVQVFRTSVVSYTSYFARVSIALNGTSDNGVRALIGPSTDVLFRYRNPSFAMWELGFKAALMTINLFVLLWFAWAAGWPGCGSVRHVALRCCRAFVSSRWSAPTSQLSFHNEARVGWTLALLVGLLAFNEPLLWATYYAPYAPGGSLRADALPFLNLAGQVTFVLLLCAYWIVEFGLLAARAGVVRIAGVQPLPPLPSSTPASIPDPAAEGASLEEGGAPAAVEGSVTPVEPPAPPPTRCAFYGPKMGVIALFWLLSLGVYGTLLHRSAGDPLYDWVAEGTDAAAAVGAGLVDSRFALAVATLLAGAAYLSYLSYLGVRSLLSCRRMSGTDRFLFFFHYIVLVATALGLVGGSIVAADVSSPSDLLFFSALYNVYAWTLAYLYAPEAAPAEGQYGALEAAPSAPEEGVREGEVRLDVKGGEEEEVVVEAAGSLNEGEHPLPDARGADAVQDWPTSSTSRTEKVAASAVAEEDLAGITVVEEEHEGGMREEPLPLPFTIVHKEQDPVSAEGGHPGSDEPSDDGPFSNGGVVGEASAQTEAAADWAEDDRMELPVADMNMAAAGAAVVVEEDVEGAADPVAARHDGNHSGTGGGNAFVSNPFDEEEEEEAEAVKSGGPGVPTGAPSPFDDDMR